MNSTRIKNDMKATLFKKGCGLSFFLLVARPVTAQGLIIPSGAYVIANTGNIVLQNNWVNNGTFTHNGGAVIFAGTTQTLGGSSSTTFNNLTVAAGSVTTIISSGQIVKGIVLSNDTLNANGNLTLLSTAAGTALIDGSGTGEVLGNVTMQRYLASGFGYKYFSSPFQGDTVGDFADEINLGASFPDVYRFDENQPSNGWFNYTTPSGTLTPLAGYTVNFGASAAPLTADLTGVVNNHTISSPTLFNHNLTYTQGFNLLGNPYPSPIDWNSATGWTKTNVDNALYYFSTGATDQYTGTYSSYINGVSSDGMASNIISAMQGFFIHVSNGTFPVSGSIAVNNNARNTNPSTIFFDLPRSDGPPPLLRLSAGFADEETASDPLVVYFKEEASGTFNKKLDALKLMNTHPGVPNLYAVATDTIRLSINALPYPRDSLTVPLGLKTARDGWITFNVRDIEQMPAGLFIYLSDTRSALNQDLRQQPRYRLFLSSGEYANRFFLKFTTRELPSRDSITARDVFKVYSSGGKLFVNGNLPSGEKGDLLITNLLGQVMGRQEISGSSYQQIPMNFIPGIYIVSFFTRTQVHTKKVFIAGP